MRLDYRIALTVLVALALSQSARGAAWLSWDFPRDIYALQSANDATTPAVFIANEGQMRDAVRYVIRGAQGSAFFTDDGVTLDVCDGTNRERRGVVRVGFEGRWDGQRIEGLGELPGKVNYLRGPDPAEWKTGIRTYAGLAYRDVWPGIDIVYRSAGRRLKWDISIAPGADLADVVLSYQGAESLWVDAEGNLRVRTGVTELVERVPCVYQIKNNSKTPVEGGFVVREDGTVGVWAFPHDSSATLVIDPASDLVWSSYIGGSDSDEVDSVAVDAFGFAYVAGYTYSSDLPTTTGAYDTTHNDNYDVFVAKINQTGTGLVYCTYVGGTGDDRCAGIDINDAGCAYVIGRTKSNNFPTTPGAYDRTFNAYSTGYWDVYVFKLSTDGGSLDYSTYLGGTYEQWGYGIAVGGDGCAYVTGYTSSTDFPRTADAYDRSYNGGVSDVFVTKLSVGGSSLAYSTLLGGNDWDVGYGIAVDSQNYAYVTGHTWSLNFPTTPGAYDGTAGGDDAFVARISQLGNELSFSTFLGQDSEGYGIAVHEGLLGGVFVTGKTNSASFPTTEGAYDRTYNGGWDAFVSKLTDAGTRLGYSTYLGGGSNDQGNVVRVDDWGCAWVTGTAGGGFPMTSDAYDTVPTGGDAFLTRLSTGGSSLEYSTYLGGSGAEYGFGLDITRSSWAFLGGYTTSTNFPVTPGVFDPTYLSYEGFISKMMIPVPTLARAKRSPDGTGYSGTARVVTGAFDGFFYIENDDCSLGIRVDNASHGLALGMRADVAGVLRTNADFERYVDASYAVQNGTGELGPLAMTLSRLGGGDWFYDEDTGEGQRGVEGGAGMNSIGLLVRTWGVVGEVESVVAPDEPMWFTIEDGMGLSVRVVVPTGVDCPDEDDFVVVTGVCSCEFVGGVVHSLLRVRMQSDITSF